MDTLRLLIVMHPLTIAGCFATTAFCLGYLAAQTSSNRVWRKAFSHG